MQDADQLRPVFNLVNEVVNTCVVELRMLRQQGGQLLIEFQHFSELPNYTCTTTRTPTVIHTQTLCTLKHVHRKYFLSIISEEQIMKSS